MAFKPVLAHASCVFDIGFGEIGEIFVECSFSYSAVIRMKCPFRI